MFQNPPTPHHNSTVPYTPCKTPSRRTASQGLQFTPSRSSPLSPRASSALNSSPLGGACKQQPPIFSLNTATPPSPPGSPQHSTPKFMAPNPNRRLFKPNPLNRSHDDNRAARRDLFLKKVQSGRFEKSMAARGGEDEMMRVIFVAEQKRWEKSLERGAPTVATILEEEAEDMTEESYGDYEEELERMARMAELQEDFVPNHVPEQDDEFDEYLDRDGQELEDLLSQMDLDVEMN